MTDERVTEVSRSTDLLLASTKRSFDLGAARTLRMVAAVNHNAPHDATWRIRAGSSAGLHDLYDSDWVACHAITYGEDGIEWLAPTWWGDGVDTGVYTSWKAGEATVATASLTLDWIRSNLFRPVKNATGANPEYVLVDGATMDVLKSKFAANVEAVTTIIVAGMKVDVIQDLGATGIRLDGVPFIEDRHCTANTMYAFGRGAAHVEQLREPIDANASAAEIQEALLQLTGQSIQLSEVERMIMAANQSPRLVVTVEALAKTGDSRKFMLTLKLQVAWKRCNATAKATLT